MNMGNLIVIDYYLRSNRGTDKIALSRVIFSADNLNQKLGYLIIVIDGKVFARNTYEHVNLGTGGKIYIVDGFGTVVSSTENNLVDPLHMYGRRWRGYRFAIIWDTT